MIAFPSMLLEPARKAGIPVPENPDKFDPEKFPGFAVFCNVQLNRGMPNFDAHWRNAEVIAQVKDEDLRKVTLAELINLGLSIAT